MVRQRRKVMVRPRGTRTRDVIARLAEARVRALVWGWCGDRGWLRDVQKGLVRSELLLDLASDRPRFSFMRAARLRVWVKVVVHLVGFVVLWYSRHTPAR